uniref:Pre-glycoprotein polyprotein GP complex n=2 Tax=Catarina virus TaxID=404768 RepID=A9CDY1_WWAVU|nr:glycoprotein precursor [Catarina virus]AFU54723.1 glycoprotein precursor [Catarina virus]
MGQFLSFLGEIPSIIHEALNIALMAVSIIAILKGITNVWRSGILQLLIFLMLAGRSCSITIGHHVELQHIILNGTKVIPFAPSACMINDTHLIIRGPFEAEWGILLRITGITVLIDTEGGSAKKVRVNNISECFRDNDDLDSMTFTIDWLLTGLGYDAHTDPVILCDSVKQDKQYRAQMNITNINFRDKVFFKLNKIFGPIDNYYSEHEKLFILIQNVTWVNQCQTNHMSSMQLILHNAHKQAVRFRKLQAFFSWTLTDATGAEMPGGYCLEKWMLVSSELKCFGNTAIAKCNLNHESEFCDMLRLFDFNKKAISTLQNKTKHQIDVVIAAVNALISDNILMKNKVRELINIPYCNYTKFWYVNHTGFNAHSLPRCWLVKNGSYLNVSDFRNEWLLESDHLISEILSKEYEERQNRTPLTLVDICFWSTLFYTASIFLHLLRIPTHRHIVGEGCPKPHRLKSDSTCACGLFKQKRRPVKWVRKM